MKGMTLVEVLIVAFVFSLIAGGLYVILQAGVLTHYTDLGVLDLQQQARNAMDWMVREMRE
ncbi:MAG: PilW family protein, partial [Candidatus Omnitrophota bacterium]